MTLEDERQILENARHDTRHFGAVYDHYYPKIFGYAMRRTANFEVARDIAADTFLKAVLALPRFEWRSNGFSPWLFQIATNELRQFFRRKRYESLVLSERPGNKAWAANLHRLFEEDRIRVEAQMAENENFARIQGLLLSLDLKYQEVIALRFFEQKNIREIAEILAKNEGTVKSLLSRGLEKLNQKMAAI